MPYERQIAALSLVRRRKKGVKCRTCFALRYAWGRNFKPTFANDHEVTRLTGKQTERLIAATRAKTRHCSREVQCIYSNARGNWYKCDASFLLKLNAIPLL